VENATQGSKSNHRLDYLYFLGGWQVSFGTVGIILYLKQIIHKNSVGWVS